LRTVKPINYILFAAASKIPVYAVLPTSDVAEITQYCNNNNNKKHLKNVGPIRHCEPAHAHSPGVATGTVARRLRIDVHDDNDDNDNDNA